MSDLILPPLRRNRGDAAKFARVAHQGQTDKAGNPYETHTKRVARETFMELTKYAGAEAASVEVDEACQIAWLHDVLEDTPYTAEDLYREGFTPNVVGGIEILTRKDGVSAAGQRVTYDEWIRWLCQTASLLVIIVKLADVEDNSDPERLAMLDEATRERLTKKYAGAADMLREAARKKGWQG